VVDRAHDEAPVGEVHREPELVVLADLVGNQAGLADDGAVGDALEHVGGAGVLGVGVVEGVPHRDEVAVHGDRDPELLAGVRVELLEPLDLAVLAVIAALEDIRAAGVAVGIVGLRAPATSAIPETSTENPNSVPATGSSEVSVCRCWNASPERS